MQPMRPRVLEAFVAARTGLAYFESQSIAIDGMDAVAALWQFNHVFDPWVDQVQGLRYLKTMELQADHALEALALGRLDAPSLKSPAVWRVMLERHLQALQLAISAHFRSSPQVTRVPVALRGVDLPMAVVLCMEVSMELPYPVADRTGFEWPSTAEMEELLRVH